ncbi:hypothetical protein HK096_010117, partial [Nowakowskiella sp. JEL0078]
LLHLCIPNMYHNSQMFDSISGSTFQLSDLGVSRASFNFLAEYAAGAGESS